VGLEAIARGLSIGRTVGFESGKRPIPLVIAGESLCIKKAHFAES